MRMLERLRVPRTLGALLLISLLFGTIVAFGTALSGPAATSAAEAARRRSTPPRASEFSARADRSNSPVHASAQGCVSGDSQLTGGTSQGPVIGAGLWLTLFSGTRAFTGGFFETVLVLFFLLISGDTFLRRLVEILPHFSDKRRAVEISQHIAHDISAYLITVTIMNAAVGFVTALAMRLCGLGDPILWGAVAFLFNTSRSSGR